MVLQRGYRYGYRPWLALLVALTAAFLSVWIVAPAPNRALLPLAVGAPEVSAWLLVAGALGLGLALMDLRRRWVSRVAAALAVGAIALASIPLARFAAVANDADLALRTALGGDYLNEIPPLQRARLRPAPLNRRELFGGLRAPDPPVRIERGIPFARAGDTTLTVDVYHPATAESLTDSLPVLVQIYGGAWQRGAPGDHSEFAEYMAALGFVVFAIDYRHAPRYTYPAPVEDVRTALAWIGANASRWHADTSRLALVGRSAGAHLAMMAAYAPDAPRIRAVINYYGPVDLVEGYRHPPSPDPMNVRDIEEAFLGGSPDEFEQRYRDASPITQVTRRLPPTLLIYGGRDHVVEPRFGTLLAGRLHAEGTTVVHLEIPWAEHAFDAVPNGPSGQLARYVTERFLSWSIRPMPDTPISADARQGG